MTFSLPMMPLWPASGAPLKRLPFIDFDRVYPCTKGTLLSSLPCTIKVGAVIIAAHEIDLYSCPTSAMSTMEPMPGKRVLPTSGKEVNGAANTWLLTLQLAARYDAEAVPRE